MTYRPFETHRGFVYPWVIDHVGHMNVQFYTTRFDEATWHFLARLGLSVGFLEQNGRAMVAVDQHTRYRREVFAGTLLHIASELLEIGRSSIRFIHRMYDSESGDELATTEFVGVYFDTTRRASAPLPSVVQERARDLLVDAAAVAGDGRPDHGVSPTDYRSA